MDEILKAVQASEHMDLIGDCSKPYALPTCKSRHGDLKTISPSTLSSLLNGDFKNIIEEFIIIDSRYPYEYNAGHIKGAINIFDKQTLVKKFLSESSQEIIDEDDKKNRNDENSDKVNSEDSNDNNKQVSKRRIIVFHCEFSSERGPSLSRFLRNEDRQLNTARYPNLCHPEIYLLEGGYKAFFEQYKDLCVPQEYLPMNSKDHKEELKKFRRKTKTYDKSRRVEKRQKNNNRRLKSVSNKSHSTSFTS